MEVLCLWTDLAIKHEKPFAGEGRGFKDAVILQSVVEHLARTTSVVAVPCGRDSDLPMERSSTLSGRAIFPYLLRIRARNLVSSRLSLLWR